MTHDECLELIALQALDLLDDRGDGVEDLALEAILAEAPELAIDLNAFQVVVADLAYGAPPLPIAAQVKDRLFDRLFPSAPAAQPHSLSQAENLSAEEIFVLKQQMDAVEWTATAPQVETGTVEVNLERREIVCFVRAEGQVRFPKHRHAGTEEIVVLEGDFSLDGQVYGSGDRICSLPGTAHLPATQRGCLL